MEKTLEQCYETLGLATDASKEEVRKAYKRLALQCHPDKNQNSPEANSKFQELGYAYKRIAEDEELGEIDEDCSEFDYWLEVFFYCLAKERAKKNSYYRELFCDECAHEIEEDEAFLESIYKKHRRNQKETTFTEEEMKGFVKFNSLKEQREFNKKLFCDSKKSTKPKNEPKIPVQKVKMKSNKQLKAEQWKREKEISKIAEEIELKKKQEEKKMEYTKECLKLKKEKEALESRDAGNGINMNQDVNGNKPQQGACHKGQGSKDSRVVNNTSAKEKPKKKQKKGRVKNENKDTDNHKADQEHRTYEPIPTATTKPPAVNSNVTRRSGISSKPSAPVSKPSAIVSKPSKLVTPPVKHLPPVTLPKPPNIWMKRLETQNEIREIQPTNEEEELRQLEIALEMSKKQVEIDKQQQQIAALQEEIRLMSMEQEKLQDNEKSPEKTLTDPSEVQSLNVLGTETKPDILTDVENCNGTLHSSSDTFNLNKKQTDLQAAKIEKIALDIKDLDDSSDSEDDSDADCSCSCRHEKNSTFGATRYMTWDHKQQFEGQKLEGKSKDQTLEYASSLKPDGKKKKPCPYGKNCCLGKKCKYSHLSVKKGGKDEQEIVNCSIMQDESQTNEHSKKLNSFLEDKAENDNGAMARQVDPVNECGTLKTSSTPAQFNHISLTEDWDDEIADSETCNSSNGPDLNSDDPTFASKEEMFQQSNSWCSSEPVAGENENNTDNYSSNTALGDNIEKVFEKRPVCSSQISITSEINVTEDWDEELEDGTFQDPAIVRLSAKVFSQNAYSECITARPNNHVEGLTTLPSHEAVPVSTSASYTEPSSLPHAVQLEEASGCYSDGINTGDWLSQPRVSASGLLDRENSVSMSSAIQKESFRTSENERSVSNVVLMNINNQATNQEWLGSPEYGNNEPMAGLVNEQSGNTAPIAGRNPVFVGHGHQGSAPGMCPGKNSSVQCPPALCPGTNSSVQCPPALCPGTNSSVQCPPALCPGTNSSIQCPPALCPGTNSSVQCPPALCPGTNSSVQCPPALCPGTNSSVQYPQKQFQANLSANPLPIQNVLTQGSQYCLPFTNVSIPGVFPGSATMHQAGLYNAPQMPSMFMPSLSYPLVQPCAPGKTSQPVNMLPTKNVANNHHETSKQCTSASNTGSSTTISLSGTSEPGTQEIHSNTASGVSLANQAPGLAMPGFPLMPNMYMSFQGNTPNMYPGVPASVNSIPNMLPNPLMALPFPVVPGFLPLQQQNLLSNCLTNTPSLLRNSSQDDLGNSSKLAVGQANNFNQHSPPSAPSKGNAVACSDDNSNPMSLIALESNYHALLQMQLKDGKKANTSCAKENGASVVSVAEKGTKTKTSKCAHEEKDVNYDSEPEHKKINEDMFKISNIRKPSSVPKVLSYAERNQ